VQVATSFSGRCPRRSLQEAKLSSTQDATQDCPRTQDRRFIYLSIGHTGRCPIRDISNLTDTYLYKPLQFSRTEPDLKSAVSSSLVPPTYADVSKLLLRRRRRLGFLLPSSFALLSVRPTPGRAKECRQILTAFYVVANMRAGARSCVWGGRK
jgi:hypothetical protein